jgi:hypothetical protein
MTTLLRGLGAAIGGLKPLELSLVFMNLILVALVWAQLSGVTNARSVNIERYVAADLEIDRVLSNCIVEGYR